MYDKMVQKLIEQFVRKSFNSLRLHLIGPDAVPKSLTFSFKTFDPQTTLASNYLSANSINSVDPDSIDKDTINKIKKVAEHYIDSIEQKTLADTSRIIGEKYDNLALQAKREGKTLREVAASAAGETILNEINKELLLQKDKTDKAVDALVVHELHNAQNAGALDGIIGSAKSLGIGDPTVFKIGVLDDSRCKYCWKLWTMPDQVTPKVYKLGELSGSPGHWKNPEPSVSPTHVRCRDILTILMPGFGFDSNGKVAYIGAGHDEYKKQRNS